MFTAQLETQCHHGRGAGSLPHDDRAASIYTETRRGCGMTPFLQLPWLQLAYVTISISF